MFPPMATMTRSRLFDRLRGEWDGFSPEERRQVLQFVAIEGERGIGAAPQNARLLTTTLGILQPNFPQEELGWLDPLVERLQELAPERDYTYQLMAIQELRRGNYDEALRIVNEVVARAPWMEDRFQPIVRSAEEGLRGG